MKLSSLYYRYKRLTLLGILLLFMFYHIHSKFTSQISGFKRRILNLIEFEQSNCYSPFLINATFNEKPATKLHPKCCKKDWIHISSDATFVFNTDFLESNKIKIKKCSYQIINWLSDDFQFQMSNRISISNNQKLDANKEFFYVQCESRSGLKYESAFARIFKSKLKSKIKKRQPINVFMLGLDSVSRENWMTRLTESSRFLFNNLNSTILNEYNIVGDGTPAALIPILTSKHEHELPKALKGYNYVDRVYPFIWNNFKTQLNYATFFNEDWPTIGTFQYRLSGMSSPPTTHYSRPFQLAIFKKGLTNFKSVCIRSRSIFQLNMKYAEDFMNIYKKQGFFGISLLNQYSHDSNENLEWIDHELFLFLKRFEANKELSSNTILVLFSDHGARFGSLRKSIKGLLNERNPFFSLYLPKLFRSRYPTETFNLETNSNRIVTPMDIYATLKHLLNLELRKSYQESGNKRMKSIFTKIPMSRNCAQAGVDPHWCGCMKRTKLNVDSKMIQMARIFVNYINDKILRNHLDACDRLELDSVNKIFLLDTFINSYVDEPKKKHWNLIDILNPFKHLRQTSIETDFRKYFFQVSLKPNGGVYEFTVSVETKYHESLLSEKHIGKGVRIDESSISRINAYGSSADCIAKNFPDLRRFCNCK